MDMGLSASNTRKLSIFWGKIITIFGFSILEEKTNKATNKQISGQRGGKLQPDTTKIKTENKCLECPYSTRKPLSVPLCGL